MIRARIYIFLAAAAAVCAACSPASPPRAAHAASRTPPITAPITAAALKTCAVRAVYALAADDFSQRAVMAYAEMTRTRRRGACDAPDLPLEPEGYRLHAAADAVEAVSTRDYAIPRDCIGVDIAAPIDLAPGEAMSSRCVIAGVVFWNSYGRAVE